MAALQTVLGGVTNLSASTVSVNDWGVQNNPYSVVIFPSLGGQQMALAAIDEWQQIHRIKARLNIKHQSDTELYTRSSAMIPLILAALQTNDTLGLANVMTCHYEGFPVTWDSPTGDAIAVDDNGVKNKMIDFVVSVVTV